MTEGQDQSVTLWRAKHGYGIDKPGPWELFNSEIDEWMHDSDTHDVSDFYSASSLQSLEERIRELEQNEYEWSAKIIEAEALEERVEKAEARAVELATAHGRVSGKLLHARERCEELEAVIDRAAIELGTEGGKSPEAVYRDLVAALPEDTAKKDRP